MKFSATRVALWSVLLAAVAGAVLWRSLSNLPPPAPEAVAQPRPFPVFDIASPSARHTAVWLMSGERNHVEGEWLAQRCREDAARREPELDTFVMTRAGPGRQGKWRDERLLVTWNGVAGSAQLTRYSDYDTVSSEDWALLDTEDVHAFARLLRDSAFLRVPPGDRVGMCHTEAITMEWCSEARYYGLMRQCEITDARPVTELADEIESFIEARKVPEL